MNRGKHFAFIIALPGSEQVILYFSKSVGGKTKKNWNVLLLSCQLARFYV